MQLAFVLWRLWQVNVTNALYEAAARLCVSDQSFWTDRWLYSEGALSLKVFLNGGEDCKDRKVKWAYWTEDTYCTDAQKIHSHICLDTPVKVVIDFITDTFFVLKRTILFAHHPHLTSLFQPVKLPFSFRRTSGFLTSAWVALNVCIVSHTVHQ